MSILIAVILFLLLIAFMYTFVYHDAYISMLILPLLFWGYFILDDRLAIDSIEGYITNSDNATKVECQPIKNNSNVDEFACTIHSFDSVYNIIESTHNFIVVNDSVIRRWEYGVND